MEYETKQNENENSFYLLLLSGNKNFFVWKSEMQAKKCHWIINVYKQWIVRIEWDWKRAEE